MRQVLAESDQSRWSGLARRWAGRRIVQLISDLSVADASSSDALAWQRLFKAQGLEAPIYARHIEGRPGGEASHVDRYRPKPDDLVLFHYTVWSEVAERVLADRTPFVMIYHNVTPPEFFTMFDPKLAADTRRGREQLSSLAPLCRLALAKSEFSRADLVAAGYGATGVLPLLLDVEGLGAPGDSRVDRELADGQTNILVCGRVAPHKRIEDAVVAYAHYRSIDPRSRLLIVGAHDETGAYVTRLRILIDRLDLRGIVQLTGRVSEAQKRSYFRAAHVYLTMSEHEGFCLPLVEAMCLGVPIVARAAAAIPETAGGAAFLLEQRRHDVAAELIHLLMSDAPLRASLIEAGRRRAEQFAPARVQELLAEHLDRANLVGGSC